MQLCYVSPSQPQTDDMKDVAAVLNRWHLVQLHEGGSRALGALGFDLKLRSPYHMLCDTLQHVSNIGCRLLKGGLMCSLVYRGSSRGNSS